MASERKHNQKESPQFSKLELILLAATKTFQFTNASDEQGPADHQQPNCYDVGDYLPYFVFRILSDFT